MTRGKGPKVTNFNPDYDPEKEALEEANSTSKGFINLDSGDSFSSDGDDSLQMYEDGFSNGIEVRTPSGGKTTVLNHDEVEWYNNIREKYLEDNNIKMIQDQTSLDMLLSFELRAHRYNNWLNQESDYQGNPLPKDLDKNIKELSAEIRALKVSLGLDKKTRDGGRGTSVAENWEFLRSNALKKGYKRNEELVLAYTILKGIQGEITKHDNSTPSERTKFVCHPDDILEFCRENFKEFDKIDAAFRSSQAMWIRGAALQ